MFLSEDFNSDTESFVLAMHREDWRERREAALPAGGLSSARTGGELAGTHGLTQRVLGSLSHSVKQYPALAMCHVNVLLDVIYLENTFWRTSSGQGSSIFYLLDKCWFLLWW